VVRKAGLLIIADVAVCTEVFKRYINEHADGVDFDLEICCTAHCS